VKKSLIAAAIAVLGAGGAFTLPAQANSNCPLGVDPGMPGGTSGTLTVGTPAGCVTASGDAVSASGYVVADGAGSNPSPLDGYLGVRGNGGGVQVVGCSDGDYDAAHPATAHVIYDSANPAGVPGGVDPACPLP